MKTLTNNKEWLALIAHQQTIAPQHMRDWFREHPERAQHFSVQTGELLLDYSRNLITDHTLDLLFQLLGPLNLRNKIKDLFLGFSVNTTENRPALHMALRDQHHTPIMVNGENIAELITSTQQKIDSFVNQIHSGKYLGTTGKPIKHIINIGIGGSHTGPMLCVEALKEFAVSKLSFHFVASVDHMALDDVLDVIDPETALFIVSSKPFTTIEAITNATAVIHWMKEKLGTRDIHQHFIAVTAQSEKAIQFGILSENIFPMWDWIGGRYSVWSAIGLPIALMIGTEQFNEFLTGGFEMDEHFRYADVRSNIPVILALIDIWYINFFHASTHAIIPYSYRLRSLPTYLQQIEMESNGKQVDINNQPITYSTGSIIFGSEGSCGQHTYYQLLHQGTHLIPIDFILINHHDLSTASALSQAQALMQGKTLEEALASHRVIPGNRPCSILHMKKLTPKNLGALIALYEHKIFVESVIWRINPFDQWGVELGKELLPDILHQVQNRKNKQGLL